MTVQDGAELAGCRQLLLFVFISIFYTSGDSICYQPWLSRNYFSAAFFKISFRMFLGTFIGI